MKFPFSMLLDFVKTDLSAEEVGDLLTMTGFELEDIEVVDGEKVLDVNVCSNRGDGLSVMGLAREVLAKLPNAQPTDLFERATRRFQQPDDKQPSALGVPVRIETDACTRFAYRGFNGVANGQAPELIRKRLAQAGHRPISLFVDLTNYVMLELGQPLHAYDLDKLQGPEIVVRSAKAGEKLTTLNGVEHTLKPDQMMICDARGPIGVAGVMGGADTEVDAGTKRVLLEAAHFVNTSVRRTRKQLGLNTEASYRFERSVDPDGVVAALNRVNELLGDLGHGDWAVQGVSDVYPGQAGKSAVRLRLSRARMLLGMDVSEGEARGYLERLGFVLSGSGDDLSATPPSWRTDVTREEDLVEELGRIHGYEKIPERLPEGATVAGGGVGGRYLAESRLVEGALRAGFDQAMTHSLRATGPLDSPESEPIAVRTPGSADIDVLRNSLLPGLADAVRRNGGSGVHFFELGPVFSPPFKTQKSLAFISVGQLYPATRQKEAVPVADFFSLKSVVDQTLDRIGETLKYESSSDDVRFHPARQAWVTGRHIQGRIGQIHPLCAEAANLPPETVMAEFHLDLGTADPSPHFHSVSRTPSVRRDIAFFVDKAVPFSNILSAVKQALPETLEDVWLFDVYEGKGVPDGQHSLAIALTLRKPDSTFTDEEANLEREKAVEALAALGATRR